MADWLEIKIRTKQEIADTVSDILEQLGALAVTYQDAEDCPIFEPKPGEKPLWPNTEVTGLFAKGTDANPILHTLRAILGDNLPIAALDLADKEWVRTWMDSFVPIKFGKRLWICPSWTSVNEENAVVVKLDPGLAFGTGTHPTTALCLEYLDSFNVKDLDIIDFGCGSGILAIAALLLGAKHATLIDIDEQAIIASKQNAENNNVADKISLFNSAKENYKGKKVPLLVANILAGPLCELEDIIASHIETNGTLVLSGLLEEQVNEVMEVYKKDFTNLESVSKEGWSRITGIKK